MISPHRPPVVKKFEADLVVLVRGHDQIKIKSARIVRSPRGHRQSSTCGSRHVRLFLGQDAFMSQTGTMTIARTADRPSFPSNR
jgi:hypothetical protein